MYLAGVTAWGAWLGRGQTGGQDYFLGNRELPWVAVMLSVVATETSTLTFLSIPGVSYLGTLGFLQLTFGYLVGRVVVSMFLLPAYYRGELSTAYALLGERFGAGARRFASAVFMVTRLLADSVRLFATAILLALITGWDYPVSIIVIGAITVVYTYLGGIKAVVWVDALQMTLYLLGALVAIVALQVLTPEGWAGILSSAGEAGKLAVLDLSFDFSVPYTLWAGVLGGGVFTMASHGTDQLLVQRLLTCRDLAASKKALVGSGVLVMGQFLIFLLVGLGLWVYYEGRTFGTTDEIFALFIVEALPPGIRGFLSRGFSPPRCRLSPRRSTHWHRPLLTIFGLLGPAPRTMKPVRSGRGRSSHSSGPRFLWAGACCSSRSVTGTRRWRWRWPSPPWPTEVYWGCSFLRFAHGGPTRGVPS